MVRLSLVVHLDSCDPVCATFVLTRFVFLWVRGNSTNRFLPSLCSCVVVFTRLAHEGFSFASVDEVDFCNSADFSIGTCALRCFLFLVGFVLGFLVPLFRELLPLRQRKGR